MVQLRTETEIEVGVAEGIVEEEEEGMAVAGMVGVVVVVVVVVGMGDMVAGETEDTIIVALKLKVMSSWCLVFRQLVHGKI